MDTLGEAVHYLQSEKGLHRLLDGWIEKYRSLGRIGGTVELTSLTEEEHEAVASLLRKDLHDQSHVRVTAAAFEKGWQQTRFAEVPLLSMLEGYAGQPLETKVEERQRYEDRKLKFFDDIARKASHPYVRLFMQQVKEKGKGTRGIHAAYDKDANRLEEQLRLICQALAALPKESDYVRLPVFAERVANDPHRFDANTECGAHFLSALQIVRSQENSTYEFTNPLSSEAASELLQSFGIIRDDLLNFVTCTGILGYACENDAAHPVWKEAVSSKTVMNVPLREILPLSFFRPYRGSAVFVVENSGVFSALLDEVSDEASPAMLCTHGQFKIAALLLIDRLVKSGTTIYYSGDLDPEGLQMAQRLVKRHPRHIRLWRYRLQDYLTHASGEVLSSMRLRKLETIEIAALSDVKAEIARLGKPAYQEAFLPALVQDLRFHYSRYG